jgi:hypothetical protein
MKHALSLVVVLAFGCGGASNNRLLGDWVGVDGPSSTLRVTGSEMIYAANGKTETSRYKWVSPREITVSREGVDMTFQVEVTATSLKLAHPNGTRRFKRK